MDGQCHGRLTEIASDVPLHECLLELFDVQSRVRSDSLDYIQRLQRLYRRLSVASLGRNSGRPVLEFTLLTQIPGPFPCFIADDKVWPLRHPALVEGFTYEQILMTILRRVRSHLVTHAGAVERNGQALLIVAESGCGKTTLTLELVRRGFRFLSDEFGAIHRQDRRVYPCPRSLRVRPQTLELLGRADKAQDAEIWMQKYTLDIEELYPGSLGQPAPVDTLVVLQPSQPPPQGDPTPFLEIQVDHLPGPFVDALRAVESIVALTEEPASIGVVLRLTVTRKALALQAVEALCQAHQVLLLNTVHKPLVAPAFGDRAHLEPMSHSQALLALLDQFLPGPGSSILQENRQPGGAARLFLELGSALQDARCYRLTPGPLEEMADLLCSVAP